MLLKYWIVMIGGGAILGYGLFLGNWMVVVAGALAMGLAKGVLKTGRETVVYKESLLMVGGLAMFGYGVAIANWFVIIAGLAASGCAKSFFADPKRRNSSGNDSEGNYSRGD